MDIDQFFDDQNIPETGWTPYINKIFGSTTPSNAAASHRASPSQHRGGDARRRISRVSTPGAGVASANTAASTASVTSASAIASDILYGQSTRLFSSPHIDPSWTSSFQPPQESFSSLRTPIADKSFRVSDYLFDTPSFLAQAEEIYPDKENDPMLGAFSTPSSNKTFRFFKTPKQAAFGGGPAGPPGTSALGATVPAVPAVPAVLGAIGAAGAVNGIYAASSSYGGFSGNLSGLSASGFSSALAASLSASPTTSAFIYKTPMKRSALSNIDPNIGVADAASVNVTKVDTDAAAAAVAASSTTNTANAANLDSSPSTILLTSTIKKEAGNKLNSIENSPTPATKSHLKKPPCQLVRSNSALEPAMGLFHDGVDSRQSGARSSQLPVMATFNSTNFATGSRKRRNAGHLAAGNDVGSKFQIIFADMNTLRASYSGRGGKKSRKNSKKSLSRYKTVPTMLPSSASLKVPLKVPPEVPPEEPLEEPSRKQRRG
ncbi:hypothetical protein FOA43_002102 [Brettanomyces nanus]|uniref:Uncharacterized protein n=1 Tax=Eeniella nana TaxID=13502 RepID=A0A875S1D8_EENNA|nr:uncharacterized protein FOA43_002102 [Brettanomyces nanus]QPG74768.1 hypothetical protein FOA43_002102 [Brettanomyces nanus]